MPKLKEILLGKKAKTKQVKTTSPMQDQLLQLINQGLESGEGPYADIFGAFNEGEFNKGVTEPELKNFKENILPQIQEGFAGGGPFQGSGQRRSQNKAAVDLQSKIAQLRYQAQQQQKQNRASGINSVLNTKQVENVQKPGSTGLIPGLVQGAVSNSGGLINRGLEGITSAITNKAQQTVAG